MEETDVYLTLPKTKTYAVNFFTQPRDRDPTLETELLGIRRKPLQHKIELEYRGTPLFNLVKPHVQGVRTENAEAHSYKLQSAATTLRGTQLLLCKQGDHIIAVPLEKVLAMRNTAERTQGEVSNIDSKKATKGEIVKQLEARLRTFQFQQDILGTEEWAPYRLVKNGKHHPEIKKS